MPHWKGPGNIRVRRGLKQQIELRARVRQRTGDVETQGREAKALAAGVLVQTVDTVIPKLDAADTVDQVGFGLAAAGAQGDNAGPTAVLRNIRSRCGGPSEKQHSQAGQALALSVDSHASVIPCFLRQIAPRCIDCR